MIHLHIHSEYSLRDSIIRIPELVSRVKEMGMDSVALTDHGTISGVWEFYLACLEGGIKPIIGMEAYIVPDVTVKVRGETRFHIVLLAKNRKGYQNLLKLASLAGTEGFYYRPRIDLPMLLHHRTGLIALTGCVGSLVYMWGYDKALRMIKYLNRMLPELYLEIMPHVWKKQKVHNLMLYEMGMELGIPLVVTQDAHYLDEDARQAHDILMKIQQRDPYEFDLHLGGYEEIFDTLITEHGYLSKDVIEGAIVATHDIADSVKPYNIPIEEFEFPKFIMEDVT